MSEKEALPSISDVAEKFTSAVRPAAEVSEGDHKGGTPTDPSLGEAKAAETKAEEKAEEVAEVKEEPKKDEPKKDDRHASRFAALARREKAAREQEATVAQRLRDMEAREQAIRDREERFSSARKSPMKALKELGFTYADLTQDVLGNYKEPEEDPIDKKLRPIAEKWDKFEPTVEEMKKELQELKSALTLKDQQTQYEKAMAEIRTTAADVEKYELINAMGDEAIDLVRDTVVEYFKKHEKLLDYSEACDIVEKYYEEEYLNRLAGTKKLKSRFPVPRPEPSKQPAKEATTKPTLTARQATAPEASPNLDDLPKHEALALLAKRLQFK